MDGASRDPEADKLRRRLQREHQARLEAEQIAEHGLRELYEKQLQLQLLESIADAANGAATVADGLSFTVASVCQYTGWQIGHAYLTDQVEGEARLRSAAIWHYADEQRFHEFRQVTETMEFPPGFGLPGRVLCSGTPAWIADISQTPEFCRVDAAGQAGLRAAAAFPVLAGSEVVGVLEFFANCVLEPDEKLLHLMAQIGVQMGRVVERKRAEEQLVDAFHDPLTGLPNRALFSDRLSRAVARCNRHREAAFAVLFIDLDRFKLVNDSLGHLAGDLLIIQVATRLGGCLRQTDTLARMGGDEFTILLDCIGNPDAPVRVAERLLDALEPPFLINGEQLYISASIGIAPSDLGYESAEEILRHADLAMYRAKTLGKHRFEMFDHSLHELAVGRLPLETRLRNALQNGEFVLHYQPIVCLASGALVGVEALVRWQVPEGDLVYPGEFIQVAEDTGLILPLGLWVLREACRSVARWQRELPTQPPLTVSINLSARQFAQHDLVLQVGAIINETGILPDCVHLEITESVSMADSERTIIVLQQLHDLGVRISIDDFGTGYSSLSYLHRFRLDVLKIDRSFMIQLDQCPEGLQIVQTILSLARNLGLEVVAEGVETQRHLTILKSLGCDFGQGYYFAKPLPEPALIALLQDRPQPLGQTGTDPGAFVTPIQ
ncbi:bifunctional diguanylate cyclase/phosphodiesterase [Pseudomonas sp. JG-B]|uniref:putative bifunctional diguanylate cyclase/phosphodiesterase n=1 Tax=Pseudomonas sp. JG-B TaxID=2603214 RepID=UPI00129ED38D|nr:EAL domain-containing protein [Pseudomonas sp. JG-B]MRK21231.1 EAL domain-containing protein [Pseudomonas sp. JG-B]